MSMRLLLLCTLLTLVLFGFVFWDIASKGAGALSLEFLLTHPRKGMTAGGILPAVIGTTYVTLLTALFAIPFGVATAIFLSEYARDTRSTRLIRAAIRNLAGVPSIIYGLFGVALFVQGMGMGPSLLASGLTLGLLTLPYIVASGEEALRNVPESYREGALALGATHWQSIHSVVLPAAMPGMVTGSLLGLSRAAGETAPILFTGVAFYLRYLPGSVWDEFMALPYHLFILSTQHHAIHEVRPLAYGTALALLGLVILLNVIAFLVRMRYKTSR